MKAVVSDFRNRMNEKKNILILYLIIIGLSTVRTLHLSQYSLRLFMHEFHVFLLFIRFFYVFEHYSLTKVYNLLFFLFPLRTNTFCTNRTIHFPRFSPIYNICDEFRVEIWNLLKIYCTLGSAFNSLTFIKSRTIVSAITSLYS